MAARSPNCSATGCWRCSDHARARRAKWPRTRHAAIAGQALALCLEAPALMAAVARRWRDRGERLALAMRAGIASGLCTLGDRGGSDRLDFTLIGTPVNLASRLQARATENGTLLDEATGLLCAPSQR
jgi:class 3 adenylate cyclase